MGAHQRLLILLPTALTLAWFHAAPALAQQQAEGSTNPRSKAALEISVDPRLLTSSSHPIDRVVPRRHVATPAVARDGERERRTYWLEGMIIGGVATGTWVYLQCPFERCEVAAALGAFPGMVIGGLLGSTVEKRDEDR